MKLYVRQETAENEAPESLINSLSTSYSACLNMGKAFIYDSKDRRKYNVSMPFRGTPICGSIIEFQCIDETFYARVTGWKISAGVAEDGTITTRMNLEMDRID